MLGKLTYLYFGLFLLAGWAGFACSQGGRESAEVGTAQVELREDHFIYETRDPSTTVSEVENSMGADQRIDPVPRIQHIALPSSNSPDRAYPAVNRHEFLSGILKGSGDSKKVTQDAAGFAAPGKHVNPHWVRAGKGFGVGAGKWASSTTVHLDDESHFYSARNSKSSPGASDHLKPMTGPFDNLKPLVFHSRATGFHHKLPDNVDISEYSHPFENRLASSQSPMTRAGVSSKPKTWMKHLSSKNRLDLMKGNERINRDRFYNRR